MAAPPNPVPEARALTTAPRQPAARTSRRGARSPDLTARLRRAVGRPLTDREAIAIVVVAGTAAAILLLLQYRGLIFFYDEWDFVQNRRDWDVDAFLAPHNEHLALVAALVFKVLFVTAGITTYWPYAVALTLSHLLAAGALFALLRSWSSNEAAVIGTTVLLFLGTAWEVLLWPFEMGVTLSLAAGAGALLALQRGTRRGDAAACALLAGALAAASLGIPMLAAALVLLVGGRGWRRLWVVAVPAALYGAWYLAYADSSARAENVQHIPVYVADGTAASLAAVFGMSPEIGRSLLVAAAVATVAALLMGWADRDRMTAALAASGLMWGLICLSRYGIAPTSTPRYMYPGAAFMLLLLAALAGRRALTAPRARAVALVLVALSLTTNIGALRTGSDLWRGYSAQVRASLGAMTEVRDHVPADFQPAPVYGPQIRAGTYFAAADDLGSPAFGPDRIRAADPVARSAADDVLRNVGAVTLGGVAPMPAGAPPEVTQVENGTSAPGPEPGCVTATPLPGATLFARAAVPAAGLQVRSAGGPQARRVDVRVARYADLAPGEPMASAPRDATVLLVAPRWTGTTEWRLGASSAGPVVICTVA